MQQITGLLVEYLAIGSASVLWILLLLIRLGTLPNDKNHPAIVGLLFPLTYVLGMISDFLGELVVHRKKEAIKKKVRSEIPSEIQKSETREIHATIVRYFAAGAKELNARSSRDRIARAVVSTRVIR